MRSLELGPCHEERILLQSCCTGAEACGATVEVNVGSDPSRVGEGTGVSVGRAVGLAVSVGGSGVEVGFAACVWAIIVLAATSAVC